jgi:hypothetical protein
MRTESSSLPRNFFLTASEEDAAEEIQAKSVVRS